MRRETFEDNVYDFDTLKDFCEEYDFEYIIEDVVSLDERDEAIESHIQDLSWRDAKEYLSDQDEDADYEWWVHDDWHDSFEPVDDYEYERMFNRLVEDLVDQAWFDEDEDEEDDDEYEELLENPEEGEEYIVLPWAASGNFAFLNDDRIVIDATKRSIERNNAELEARAKAESEELERILQERERMETEKRAIEAEKKQRLMQLLG